VLALLRHRGRLIAGGEFTLTGCDAVANLASWDGTEFEAVGEGTDGAVRALAEYRDELVVGGDFDVAGGAEVARVARWDGEEWRGFDETLLPAWSIESSHGPIEQLLSVRELEAIGGHLYVAGEKLIGSETEPTRGIIRWNEDDRQWSALETGLEGVSALEAFGDAVLLGGGFYSVGDDRVPSRGIAAWRDGPLRGDVGRWDPPANAPLAFVSRSADSFGVSPNPFRLETTFRFHVSSSTRTRMTIHDVQGRLVMELVNGPRAVGEHVASWDGLNRLGRRVPAGIYFVRLERGEGTIARKVLRIR
jgi:hypothetical protein